MTSRSETDSQSGGSGAPCVFPSAEKKMTRSGMGRAVRGVATKFCLGGGGFIGAQTPPTP